MAKTVAVLLVLILAILTVPQANGQGEAGKFGLGVILSAPTSSYLFKYWVTSNSALELGGSFYQIKPKHRSATTQWGIGLGYLQHLVEEDCSPYLGVRLEMMRLKDYSDYGGGVVVGIGKFFGRRFSVGGELQLTLWKTDDEFSPKGFTNKSTVVSTVGLGFLHFYFK